MEYETITDEDKRELLKAHLKQAEADHFIHSLQVDEATAVLESLPPDKGKEKNPERENVRGTIKQLENYKKAAEKKREVVKQKLSELPVEPEPVE